ncbi:TonB-dependent receptor [Conservatibacter flavescens]|uniref:TonB-dependent receptor n=1 Tax=Conservatibacter flavescens TaxID=28161 RepID=A0A2M8S5C2_9PAST|nr:TonB-dependent receptor [Conservatibacter flavescens]PJG86323.1 hypothetical protein CVP05_00480 [Conservatibacter flavescens]
MAKKLITAVSVATLSTPFVSANESQFVDNALDTIYVSGDFIANAEQRLNADTIARKPKGNGSITGLLKGNPAVQFSDTANNSTKGGEIAPEIITIHGEPYYNNQFILDGLSNNDIMNPGASNGGYKSEKDYENPARMTLAPGSPEAFYVDSSLLKNLTVYDSNVPAKFSHFTGGVLEAELKEADPTRVSGMISYRTTRDSWTKFQLSDKEQDEGFYEADAIHDMQPKFVKHIFNFTYNQPLSAESAALFSYNRTQSKMPEYHKSLQKRQKERRLNETFMLKLSHQLTENHLLSATTMYSPHSATFFLDNVRNGRYQTDGGGWRFNLDSKLQLDWGQIHSIIGYQYQRNRIKYDGGYQYHNWQAQNMDFDWCTTYNNNTGKCTWAREGGLGELSSQTQTSSLKQDYDLNSLTWGTVDHNIDFGWQADIIRAKAQRPQDLYYFSATTANAYKNVATNCTDCIAGKQYANNLMLYPAYGAKVNVYNYSAYVADDIFWKRLKLTPGVNISYDSFLKNLNIAPRFAFNLDVFNDNKVHLTGGANRYYAGNMLAYALRANIACNQSYRRTSSTADWLNGNCSNHTSWANSDSLKTPHSDEVNLGFSYQLADNILSFNWVRRDSRNQFTPVKIKKANNETERTMSNNGQGTTNTFTLDLRTIRPYQVGLLELGYRFGLRYQHRKTNYHGNYDDSLIQELTTTTPYRYYLFEGNRYDSINDFPPINFNRPWEGYLELQTDIPSWHLKWSHAINYKTGYKRYLRYQVQNCLESSQPQACGDYKGGVWDYRLTKYSDKATLDWHFIWSPPINGRQQLELSLDVLNVFNSRVPTSSANSSYLGGSENQSFVSYETGRQFWAGIAYKF